MLSNIRINLQSKTISDTFTATETSQPTLGATVSRTILGRTWSFVVDQYRYNTETGLYEITGTYDINKMMGKDVSLSDLAGDSTASDIAGSIISGLGKSHSLSFSDFTPTGIKSRDGTTNKYICTETYASMLQKLFGWTDIVPSTLVNVFERGDTVYALQRGNETGTVSLDSGQTGGVVYERSLLRLLYDSDKAYYLTGEASDGKTDNSSDATDQNTYLSGQFTDYSGQQTLSYSYGLLTSEVFKSTDGTISSTTEYTYSTTYPPANLLTKTLTRTEEPIPDVPSDLTSVTLPYRVVTKIVNSSNLTNTMALNNKDLVSSTEEVSTTTSGYNITDTSGTKENFSESESHTTMTMYSDMGQGQWSVTTYKDTKLTGSQVVTGNPGAKASPYSIKYNSTMASRRAGHVTVRRVKLSGRFAGAMNLNVSDADTLSRVAGQIEALNGKTLERVSLIYYGTALADFTSTITFKSNVYFLESNGISVTPEGGVQQAVTMVRWY